MAYHSVFYEGGNINSKYNVEIFWHFFHQRHKYLFWLQGQGVCD
jgi:hypothetical protein